ncbi:hypothetical protein M758_3G083400, partial [Ceratodon purpureus]
ALALFSVAFFRACLDSMTCVSRLQFGMQPRITAILEWYRDLLTMWKRTLSLGMRRYNWTQLGHTSCIQSAMNFRHRYEGLLTDSTSGLKLASYSLDVF